MLYIIMFVVLLFIVIALWSLIVRYLWLIALLGLGLILCMFFMKYLIIIGGMIIVAYLIYSLALLIISKFQSIDDKRYK